MVCISANFDDGLCLVGLSNNNNNDFIFNFINLIYVIGHRAKEEIQPTDKPNQRGLIGNLIGAVSNGVKIGTYVLDSVHQRTNDVIHSALH